MRKTMVRVLLGAGAFSLSLAGLTAAVAAPALLKAPLAYSSSADITGPALRIDAETGELVEGEFRQYRAVGTKVCRQAWCGGEGRPIGDDQNVVYESYSESTFAPAGSDATVELTKTIVTQAFDRSSGEGRPDFRGDATRSEAHAFKLPTGTEKKTYELYDGLTRKAFPLEYVGEKTVAGLDVYEFKQVVPATNTGPMPVLRAVPGVWVGEPESAVVMADQWIEDTDKRVWVEPVTGRIVGGTSNTHVWAQTADGRKVDLLRLDGAAPTEESLARTVAETQDVKGSAVLLTRGPWLLGALGAALLAAGGVLLARRPVEGEHVGGDVEVVLPTPRGEAPSTVDLRA